MGAEEQHKSNTRPFGETTFTGVGKSADKLHRAAWSAASKRLHEHLLPSSSLPDSAPVFWAWWQTRLDPAGSRAQAWPRGELFSGISPGIKPGFPAKISPFHPAGNLKSAPDLPTAGQGFELS